MGSFIFSKPTVLVYVHRSGLIVSGKRVAYKRLLFPQNLVANMEVLNPTKFIALCQDFFAANELKKKRVLVILDNDLVFGKKIELDKAAKPEALAQAFIDAMPFRPGQRTCLVLQYDHELQLLATNYDLYGSVAEALRGAGVAKIFAISPVAAYDLEGTDRKVSALTEHFIKNASSARAVNFAATDPL